jgi:hypothetical protein
MPGKDLEGNSYRLFWDTITQFAPRDWRMKMHGQYIRSPDQVWNPSSPRYERLQLDRNVIGTADEYNNVSR